MAIILGFGQSHIDKSKRIIEELAKRLKGKREEKEIEKILDDYIKELGTFKDKGWKYFNAHFSVYHDWSTHFGCVIEGTVSHYRDDHPFSPDGYASMDMPFCLTIQNDDVSGERQYISI